MRSTIPDFCLVHTAVAAGVHLLDQCPDARFNSQRHETVQRIARDVGLLPWLRLQWLGLHNPRHYRVQRKGDHVVEDRYLSKGDAETAAEHRAEELADRASEVSRLRRKGAFIV